LDDTDKLAVSLYGNGGAAGDTSIPVSLAGADAVANTVDGMRTVPMPMLFNGTTWDRQRGNQEMTLFASAARTATVASALQTNYNARGLMIFVDVTAVTDTPAVTPILYAVDPVSADVQSLWQASTAIATTGNRLYVLYPGNTDGAQLTDKDTVPLPRSWKLYMSHGDADSITYSVGMSYIL